MNARIEKHVTPAVRTSGLSAWRRTRLVECLVAVGLLSSACSAEQPSGVAGQGLTAADAPSANATPSDAASAPMISSGSLQGANAQTVPAVSSRAEAGSISEVLPPDPIVKGAVAANEMGAADAKGADGDRSAVGPSATLTMAQPLLLASAELGGDNIVSSSASLVQALLLARAGAAGETLAAFDRALFNGRPTQDLSAERLEPAEGSRGVTLSIANAAYLAADLEVTPGYAPALEALGAPLQRVDFRSAATLNAINAWFAERTGGKIQGMLDRLEPDTRFLLANALHFRGDWNEPFDPQATRPGPFAGADDVHYMHADRMIAYTEYDGARAIRLGFRDLRHAMLVILPDGDPLEWLRAHPEALAKAVAGPIGPRMVAVRLPRFDISGGGELAPALQQMGLKQAFGPNADFTALSAEPIRLGSVVHRATLSVDETGAEASAATAVTGTRSVKPASIEFHVDRPFIAVVLDRKRQLPIVTAIVRKP